MKKAKKADFSKTKKDKHIKKYNNTKMKSEFVEQSLENKLLIKQKEVNKIIDEKIKLLSTNTLSYLEYLELREEITRLNSFKENIEKQIQEII